MCELVLEPTTDDVDGKTTVRQVIGGSAQFRQHGRLPESRMHRGDHLELLSGQEKRKAEARGFVLEFGPVARLVTYLAQGVLEAVVLGGLCQLLVVLVVPAGPLLDVGGDQTTTDIGHPVRELDLVGDTFSRHETQQTCSSQWFPG